jgi:hypothetical protein
MCVSIYIYIKQQRLLQRNPLGTYSTFGTKQNDLLFSVSLYCQPCTCSLYQSLHGKSPNLGRPGGSLICNIIMHFLHTLKTRGPTISWFLCWSFLIRMCELFHLHLSSRFVQNGLFVLNTHYYCFEYLCAMCFKERKI